MEALKNTARTAMMALVAASSLAGSALADHHGYGAQPGYGQGYDHAKQYGKTQWPVTKEVIRGRKLFLCTYWSEHDYKCEFVRFVKNRGDRFDLSD